MRAWRLLHLDWSPGALAFTTWTFQGKSLNFFLSGLSMTLFDEISGNWSLLLPQHLEKEMCLSILHFSWGCTPAMYQDQYFFLSHGSEAILVGRGWTFCHQILHSLPLSSSKASLDFNLGIHLSEWTFELETDYLVCATTTTSSPWQSCTFVVP